jgi:hypothetical protein
VAKLPETPLVFDQSRVRHAATLAEVGCSIQTSAAHPIFRRHHLRIDLSAIANSEISSSVL